MYNTYIFCVVKTITCCFHYKIPISGTFKIFLIQICRMKLSNSNSEISSLMTALSQDLYYWSIRSLSSLYGHHTCDKIKYSIHFMSTSIEKCSYNLHYMELELLSNIK